MTLFAHKNFLVSVSRAEEDGKLLVMSGEELPVMKGMYIITDQDNHSYPLTEERFKGNYLPVQRVKEKPVKKQLSPFEELYAQQIAEFNGTLKQDESDLHIKNDKLVGDKAF